MEITGYLTSLLIKVFAGQETNFRTGCQTIDWFKKLGKEYDKVAYCYQYYLSFMQGTSLVSQVALGVKNLPAKTEDIRDVVLIPVLGRSLDWEDARKSTTVFLPEKSLGAHSP